MGGRGRGRTCYRKNFTGAEELAVSNQPPPLYPPLQFKPVKLLEGSKITYLVTLKQQIRNTFKESGYYIPPVSVQKDIERYTDKYQQIPAEDQVVYDKTLFPKELFEDKLSRKRKRVCKSNKVPAKKPNLEKLEKLEEGEEKDEEEKEEEEFVDEEENEEIEEETDYGISYFDNGENYLDEDEDNDEGGYE